MAKLRFHWDPVNDCVTHETDGAGNTLVRYTNEPSAFGPLISETRNGTTYAHHYDALGSTTILTDDSGAVTDTFQEDAWGNRVARTGTTPTRYTWVGRWGYQDDSAAIGGYYVRARSYQPAVARWSAVDPLPSMLQALYLYLQNNSISDADASGLQGANEKPCAIAESDVPAQVTPVVQDFYSQVAIDKDIFPFTITAFGAVADVSSKTCPNNSKKLCCHRQFFDEQITGNQKVIKPSTLGWCQPITGHAVKAVPIGTSPCSRAATPESQQLTTQFLKKYNIRGQVQQLGEFLKKVKNDKACCQKWVHCSAAMVSIIAVRGKVQITTEDLKTAIDFIQNLGYNPPELQTAEQVVDGVNEIFKQATGKVPAIQIKKDFGRAVYLYVYCADGDTANGLIFNEFNPLQIKVTLVTPKQK